MTGSGLRKADEVWKFDFSSTKLVLHKETVPQGYD